MCGGVIEDIGGAISDVVSGAGDILADIDPGPALGDVAESVGNVGEQAFQGVSNVVEDVGQGIGSGLASVDEFVNREIPGGWITPAVIAATVAAPYAAPLFAEAAGAGALAGEAGALTTAELLGGAGGAFIPVEGASFALPATASAAGGAAASTAAQSVASSAKAAASAIASSGSAGETLGLLSNPIIKSALTGGGYGALTGGVTAALTGQDALKGALIGGATGGVLGGGEAAFFPELAKWAAGSVPNAGILGAGRGAASGALNTLFGGGDLQKNVLYGGIGGGALGAGSEYFFPTASQSFSGKEGDAPRWASTSDIKENAQQILDKYKPNQLDLSLTDRSYSDFGLNPQVRTGGGYDILDPEYITNRGGYGQGGYSGIGIDPAIENLYGGSGLNPNIEYYTRGLANNAEALSQSSGINISRNEFDARGGLTAEQEAALDRALTAADYAAPSSWYSGLGNLGSLLGAKALGGLGGAGGGAGAAGRAGGGSFVPKGMVDYAGILNLLAPKTTTRTSLLG